MSNKQMTASTSVRIRMDDVKVFGPGIAELLERIDRCESIRTATMEMKIAYSKAWTMLRSCEAALSYPLIQRKVGGAGGGGSTLTPEGRSLLERYRQWEADCKAYAKAQPELGQSHSLRLGLAACRESDGCLFLTGDQPFLSVETLHRLINAWEKEPGGIWGCEFEGRFSIPSIFPAAVYGELLTQGGDVGGREVMRAHPELVHTIPAPPQEHFDIDTVADLTAAQQK